MKVIFDIANGELKKLFYSPIAFLLLVIFTFYAGSMFTSIFGMRVAVQARGWPIQGITSGIYRSSTGGFYQSLLQYIYLFFPLLTMNIMSRDIGSGAIKLLLSSPVTNRQVVLGKYLTLVIFSLLLMLIIFCFNVYALLNIENADTVLTFGGLIGIFLLCCTYAAIGLFVSSLTPHPVVAAIGTLCILFLMNSIGNVGQEYPVVREITYWLSLRGRVATFYKGLISTEDFIYFTAVIAFFIALTLIRLRSRRITRSRASVMTQYAVCIALMSIVGYFTSMPKFKSYIDLSREQSNTLSRESQKVVSKMDGGLTITTYVNMLENNSSVAIPANYMRDINRFEQYTRFKPEIEMKYVYYYKLPDETSYSIIYPGFTEQQIMDTLKKINDYSFDIVPYSEISDKIDLSGEQFRFVRLLERENGQKTFLRIFNDPPRHPDERQITAAMKRIVEPLPKVGFVTGHGERTGSSENDRGYSLLAQEKPFRYSLINNGFDFQNVSLLTPVPDNIDILVIADPKQAYNETEMRHYHEYIDRGGNLLIAGEPGKQTIMNALTAPLGARFMSGTISNANPQVLQDLTTAAPIVGASWNGGALEEFISKWESHNFVTMNGAVAVTADSTSGYKVHELFATDSTSFWNEMETDNFYEDSAIYNPMRDGAIKPYVPVIALEKNIGTGTQKIIITGDADWISNSEVLANRKGIDNINFRFVSSAFYWLSDNRVPINTERDAPIDNKVYVNKDSFKIAGVIFIWVIPIMVFGGGWFVWIRRKRR